MHLPRGGMNEAMRLAAQMQRKIEATKKRIKDFEVTGSAAGEKVKVTVTYEGKVKQIVVDPEFLAAEGLEMALDSICAATNTAMEEADKLVDAELAKVTGGIKLPTGF
ncbi:MAG: YbaB/EbfC family nucleoid-associated protein [Polyangiaceae bacterium]